MKNPQFLKILLVVIVLVMLACSVPSTSNVPIEETQIALAVQQTSLAIQQSTLEALQQVTVEAPTAPPAAETYTPYPTYTPVAVDTPQHETATAEPTSVPKSDMAARIKASNVLVYEDVAGVSSLAPIVGNTVNAMGFSGGKVINTGDAMGRFREYANSATKWDLIIVSAEVRSGFSGELFEVLYDPIADGAAVIIEVWYLDQVASGKIAPILSNCGVTFSRDWRRDLDYDPFRYSIYWLDTSHPLISEPHVAQAPSYPYPQWFGDAGDLIRLGSGGDAVLVGGLYANRKSDYGVLASCIDMAPLWATLQYAPMWWNRESVIKDASGFLILKP